MPTMPTPAQPGFQARKLFLIFLLVLIPLSIFLTLQPRGPWVVPEAEKSRKNPLVPSSASPEEIKPVYLEDCAKCHGETGKGDGSKAAQYRPAPTDFTDAARLGARTDGELFYKISEGRRPMPGFKGRLTEDQRWRLVLLIRSFARPVSAPAEK
ncbi:MAG TPA: c-type cytochrome [Candidatus Dormibacteraeota bacterium]|nr:c-type cytochrome [Candidatus Dormibacteraeota bacterium]